MQREFTVLSTIYLKTELYVIRLDEFTGTRYGVARKTRSDVMLKLVKTKSTRIQIAFSNKLISKSTLSSVSTDTVL